MSVISDLLGGDNVKIYTLSNSLTGEIKYVGKTKYSLDKRLSKHLVVKDKSYRTNWIKSLLIIGEKPQIELLEEVSINDWQFWEKYWISQFKTWGFKLTNLSGGGEGNMSSPSNETREKIRNTLRKKYKTGEIVANTSGFILGRTSYHVVGHNLSEKTKEKIRQKRLGFKLSQETKDKIGIANKNKVRSEKEKQRLRTLRLGKKKNK